MKLRLCIVQYFILSLDYRWFSWPTSLFFLLKGEGWTYQPSNTTGQLRSSHSLYTFKCHRWTQAGQPGLQGACKWRLGIRYVCSSHFDRPFEDSFVRQRITIIRQSGSRVPVELVDCQPSSVTQCHFPLTWFNLKWRCERNGVLGFNLVRFLFYARL